VCVCVMMMLLLLLLLIMLMLILQHPRLLHKSRSQSVCMQQHPLRQLPT
jgi:hypothetical protein